MYIMNVVAPNQVGLRSHRSAHTSLILRVALEEVKRFIQNEIRVVFRVVGDLCGVHYRSTHYDLGRCSKHTSSGSRESDGRIGYIQSAESHSHISFGKFGKRTKFLFQMRNNKFDLIFQNGPILVRGIMHVDHKTQSRVRPTISQGGIGFNFASVNILSQRGHGINSTVRFFG